MSGVWVVLIGVEWCWVVDEWCWVVGVLGDGWVVYEWCWVVYEWC